MQKKTKNILITRTFEQSQGLELFLDNKGYRVLIEPVFVVDKFSQKVTNNNEASVIITSANAILALESSNLEKNIRIFAVGERTAGKLKNCGFNNIIVAPKPDAKSLLKIILKKTNRGDSFIYFHGDKIKLDFAKELGKRGCEVDGILSYKKYSVENFSKEFVQFSNREVLDYILFFSDSAVESFFKLAKKHDIFVNLSQAQILCFSKSISTKCSLVIQNYSLNNLLKRPQTFDKLSDLKKFYG